MKNLLLQYAEYNLWANNQITEILNRLTEQQLKQEFPSSFKSIFETVQHLCFAEDLWYRRVKMKDTVTGHVNTEETPIALFGRWADCSAQWVKLLQSSHNADFEKMIRYTNLKGIPFNQPLGQIMQHLFNHQTYHRGQLITLLHLLGITQLPSTDFIVFARNKPQNQ